MMKSIGRLAAILVLTAALPLSAGAEEAKKPAAAARAAARAAPRRAARHNATPQRGAPQRAAPPTRTPAAPQRNSAATVHQRQSAPQPTSRRARQAPTQRGKSNSPGGATEGPRQLRQQVQPNDCGARQKPASATATSRDRVPSVPTAAWQPRNKRFINAATGCKQKFSSGDNRAQHQQWHSNERGKSQSNAQTQRSLRPTAKRA